MKNDNQTPMIIKNVSKQDSKRSNDEKYFHDEEPLRELTPEELIKVGGGLIAVSIILAV